ncbi:MAG TPA: hypothetical protein VGI39_21500 [Polyangiaceae bacterium]|jgi:hypothetical protein
MRSSIQALARVLPLLALSGALVALQACTTDDSDLGSTDGGPPSDGQVVTFDGTMGTADGGVHDATVPDTAAPDAAPLEAGGDSADAAEPPDSSVADAADAGETDAGDADGAPPPDAGLDAGDGGTCTYTLSGATTGSGPCNVNFNQSSAGLSFQLAAIPGTKPLMSFTTFFNSSTPQTGTYTTANTLCSTTGITVNPPNASPQYEESLGTPPPCGMGAANAQGTFSLDVTYVGFKIVEDAGTVWLAPHGTFTASAPGFPHDVNSPGTVTVMATF